MFAAVNMLRPLTQSTTTTKLYLQKVLLNTSKNSVYTRTITITVVVSYLQATMSSIYLSSGILLMVDGLITVYELHWPKNTKHTVINVSNKESPNK